jgi:hypothetical protein
MARIPATRYGIAEWFGNDIVTMTPEQRQSFAQVAILQDQNGDLSSAPNCPFLSTVVENARCNKASGVCSIRKFSRAENNSGEIVANDKVVTVCPTRFLQTLSNGENIFTWISEKILEISNPIVVKETPFLRKISDVFRTDEKNIDADNEDEGKKAGRIDWILIDPFSMESNELDWCAVETQALYFSGNKMRPEFDAYAETSSTVLFPIGKRRPDYRSSGPKRLSPQLEVKVPVLRNWGKKVIVLIDRCFFENMNVLDDPFPRAKNDQERRDNSEVIWFVVDYDDHLNMYAYKVIYTTLESSKRALNATEPLSKSDFTNNLKMVINDASRSNKVFKV